VVITGANLRIVNGRGSTDCGPEDTPIPDCPNGLGNLIVGYNEPRGDGADDRTGSHNVVLGKLNNFSRFGGVVVGLGNEISGDFASVYGGIVNRASGELSSVSGGITIQLVGDALGLAGEFSMKLADQAPRSAGAVKV
jgi:hypothetical protein